MRTRSHSTSILAAVALLFSLVTFPAKAAAFDHSHALLDKVLKAHVKESLVDYSAIKADGATLRLYLRQTSRVTEPEFDGWTEAQQIAFLMNLYNAGTLKLITDHYPISSIKKIGGFFSGPWDQKVISLFGKTTTLGSIEHDLLRKNYQEPRLHFAIVCAAVGCPPLRAEAYTAEKLNVQLEEQGRLFLRSESKNRVDVKKRTLHLSPIFKWFDDDFEAKSGTVQKFVTPYFKPTDQAALQSGRWKIKYTRYDWSLNKQ